MENVNWLSASPLKSASTSAPDDAGVIAVVFNDDDDVVAIDHCGTAPGVTFEIATMLTAIQAAGLPDATLQETDDGSFPEANL